MKQYSKHKTNQYHYVSSFNVVIKFPWQHKYITIIKILQSHTLKVNELPSHSHRIPGYEYGAENSGYIQLILDYQADLTIYGTRKVENDFVKIQTLFDGSISNYSKNNRVINLGTNTQGSGSEWIGNNEHSHKNFKNMIYF